MMVEKIHSRKKDELRRNGFQSSDYIGALLAHNLTVMVQVPVLARAPFGQTHWRPASFWSIRNPPNFICR